MVICPIQRLSVFATVMCMWSLVWSCSGSESVNDLALCGPEDDAGIWKNSSRAADHPYYPLVQRHFNSKPAALSVFNDPPSAKSIQGLEFVRPNCRNLDPWKIGADAELLTGKHLYLFGDSLSRQLSEALSALTHHIPSFTIFFENVYCLSPLLTDAQLDRVFAPALLHASNNSTESVMLINLGMHYNVMPPCTFAQWDRGGKHCNLDSGANVVDWDDDVHPMRQKVCGLGNPARLALDVARLMQWITLRKSQLPQKLFWIQSTPQHPQSFSYNPTTDNSKALLDVHGLIDDAYVAQHKLMTWRNDITDVIVARFPNVVSNIAAQRVLLPRVDSHSQRIWVLSKNRTKIASPLHVDITHYAVDSAAWLEHVNHVLTSIVSTKV